ncbi:2-keto-4-pentenoate hydratase/2-oxohepta-3-ene-1,7-dioic acid hydratase in catechol pathway [Bacillus mesophilus]|uniref:Fumarylacetoacetate hydrolase family protein n=1 Tax=Bacillus mesophilus TaxID=1808955 RepID=A0A6M0Q2E2_9BACI|nr:fumarylacetoacetate hydrolase family protein [Bacillus mesophilus]MBM7659689.1 2-keto-4-pentenoate hydratase/2-oxohepta-3-ene-1,7-dioic acid hydratase in catechol pathway [Bacillus mesophilus]NEY70555.1 fumarylacetoacetate hydrolase family protein [Bacillus mesophilus]
MVEVKNIFCIGRNYANHALELGNAIPTSPILFSKPTHALVKADGSQINFPGDRGEIHHELEIVIHIGKEVNEEFEVEDVVDQIALGIDFTLRDEQSKLKEKGHPWLKAKGFQNSAIITDFWKFPGVSALEEVDFSLLKNGEAVQVGNIKDMMFDFKQIIQECNYYFGLKKGDIIYTGTPEGVGPIQNGDTIQLMWNDDEKGNFKVQLD